METRKLATNSGEFSEQGRGSAVLAAYGLGAAFGLGIGLVLISDYADFGLFLIALSLFHLWEYVFNALYHPDGLGVNSFLLNHSREYHLAIAGAVVEYFVEKWFLFDWKGNIFAFYVGLLVVVFGQFVRTFSMITAGSNFHHFVQDERSPNHKLITFGIYQYLRHPAYFGFFWWAIGTQILLFNPLMCAAFYLSTLSFFKTRIEYEESTLIAQYPDDYIAYRRRTPVYIPGIE